MRAIISMAAFCVVIEISWALHSVGILNSPFVYESGNIHARLRGGEVEGGPFGLMLAAVLGPRCTFALGWS